MNNTKTIFKSLLIMIVAISLFTVSCSKDEGGKGNPFKPEQTKTTITADSITAGLKGLGTITIGKMDFDFNNKFNAGATATMTGTTSTTASGTIKMPTADELQNQIKNGLKVSGATVSAKAGAIPAIDTSTPITVTITITPASGNSFDEKNLTPYTKGSDGKVTVTLTLSPEAKGGGNKKWNGTELITRLNNFKIN